MQIVAECGVNFANLDEAFEMIYESKLAHVNYCKFQLFSEIEIQDSPLYSELKKRILTEDDVVELVEFGDDIDQKIMFTPMHLQAVDWLEMLDISPIKIRYADRYNDPLLNRTFETNATPIFMSVDDAYLMPAVVISNLHRIKFLFCVPKYPSTVSDYDPFFKPSAIYRYAGISDHTKDFELASKALYIRRKELIIEKHVMLDNSVAPLEESWSVSFSMLKEFIEREKNEHI